MIIKTLAAMWLAALLAGPAFAAAETEKNVEPEKTDYSFHAGAPAPETILSPRLSAGEGGVYRHGMTDHVGSATEVVDSSNALEGEHRRAQEEALRAKDAFIDRNPDRNSPDKDRIHLVDGRVVSGNVKKKDAAGLWLESGGNQTFYSWPELGRPEQKK